MPDWAKTGRTAAITGGWSVPRLAQIVKVTNKNVWVTLQGRPGGARFILNRDGELVLYGAANPPSGRRTLLVEATGQVHDRMAGENTKVQASLACRGFIQSKSVTTAREAITRLQKYVDWEERSPTD
jgi:hypothetical protein